MKYNHNQVCVDNILFDSEQEADYYRILKAKQAKGEIFDLKAHPEFVLIPPFVYESKQIKATVYTPDFTYKEAETNKTIAVEVKGYPTPDFDLRVKLFKANYPYIHLVIMQYSKGTGWLERTDYLKERKKINAAKAIDRFMKNKEAYEAQLKRYEDKLDKAKFELSQCHTEKGMEKAKTRAEFWEEKISSLMANYEEEKSK